MRLRVLAAKGHHGMAVREKTMLFDNEILCRLAAEMIPNEKEWKRNLHYG